MKRRTSPIAAALLACALALAAAVPAHAAEPVAEIAAALATLPGGQVIDSRTAYWPGSSMTLTVPDPRLREAVGDCPNGSICAYSGALLTGSRLSWTLCGTYSTTVIGAIRSIANAKSTGTLQARYGTTVVASSTAQSWASVTGTVDNVHC